MRLRERFRRTPRGPSAGPEAPAAQAAPPTSSATARDASGTADAERADARQAVPVVPADPVAREIAEADRLVAAGDPVGAVDHLARANADLGHPSLDIRLVELRHEAARAIEPGPGRPDWPPVYADPFPEVTGRVPEADAGRLTTELLGGAVAHHGALVVRGVFGQEQVARTAEAIERTHQSQQVDDGTPAADLGAWYRPLRTGRANEEVLRRMVAGQGGTWLADSPASTARILQELDAAGVTGAIAGHLGERPYFSLQKSTLRRSLPIHKNVAWHQDGSFLDRDVRTMNVWVALSPCGGDLPSPGLEVVPRRIEEILPVDGVMSPHSISYDLVAEIAAETPTVVPEFAPGDAIVFDERFLHRTHLTATMTEIRYALECWFFAPSHQATTYTPLLV